MMSLNQVIQVILLVSCTQYRTVIEHIARVSSTLGSSRRSSKLRYGLTYDTPYGGSKQKYARFGRKAAIKLASQAKICTPPLEGK